MVREKGVQMQLIKTPVTNELRELRNYVAIFSKEYDLPAEVVNELERRIERIAVQLQKLVVTLNNTTQLHNEALHRGYWPDIEEEDFWPEEFKEEKHIARQSY